MTEQILGLITPTMALVFSLVFVVMWHRGRMGNYVLAFGFSYLFFAIGFAVTHLLNTAAPWTWLVTQFFYSLAVATSSWGMFRRVDQPGYPGLFFGIYALSAITLGAAILVSSDIASRLVLVNIAYGVMKIVTLVVLLGAPRRDAIDKLIIVMQAIFAAQFLIRPSVTLMLEQSILAGSYRASLYYSVLSFSLTLLVLMGAMVLLSACIYDQIKNVKDRAELDVLTGLRSRRRFEQEVIAEIDKAKQAGIPVSLVVADIDHFKSVNDVWGHQVGDQAIAAFGSVIANTIRDHDVAGRIGGEEFCILAWNCEGEAAIAMAERIRTRLAATPIPGMPDNHRLSASFGVAGRGEGEGYGKIFARADAALLTAKEDGRNRTVFDEVRHGSPVTQLILQDRRSAEA